MRYFLRYIILSALVCFFAPDVLAQDDRDSLNFDAMDYSLQKRYSKRSERFVSAPFHDNTFIAVFGGAAQLFDSPHTTYSMGPSVGFSLGKWFDDASGLRVSTTWRDYTVNTNDVKVMSHAAEVSYLYNMTSYKYARVSSDFCDVLLVSGVGFLHNSTLAGKNMGLDVHLGLNVVMRVFDHVDFFFEPMGRFEYMFSESEQFGFSYGINMGMTYNYISKRASMPQTDFRKDRFVSVIGGANFQISDYVIDDIGVLNSLGPHVSIAYGRWYSDLFALRLSAFYAGDVWNKYKDEYVFTTQYFGARIEGMLEFLHFAHGYEKWRVPMTFSLLFGPEFGGIYKEDIHENIFESYLGATMALQYKCRLGGPVSFLLEPRVSCIPFNYKTVRDVNTIKTNYVDYVFNMNIGLEFAF